MRNTKKELSETYLKLKLEYVFYLIKEQVERYLLVNDDVENYGSCFISKGRINELLNEPFAFPEWAKNIPLVTGTVRDNVAKSLGVPSRIRREIEQIEESAKNEEIQLDFERLCRKFKFNDFDENLLLLCALNELDHRFESIISFLNNDITRKGLSINMALILLSSSYTEKVKNRNNLYLHSPLVKYNFLVLSDDPQSTISNWSSKTVCLHEDIVPYLISDGGKTTEKQCISEDVAGDMFDYPIINTAYMSLKSSIANSNLESYILLVGDEGEGKREIVKSICDKSGYELISVDVERVGTTEKITDVLRKAACRDSLIYWQNSDTMFEKENQDKLKDVIDLSKNIEIKNIFGTRYEYPFNENVSSSPPSTVKLPKTTKEERYELIKSSLRNEGIPDNDIINISEVYRFGRAQIRDIVAVAKQIAGENNRKRGQANSEDLAQACQRQSNQALGKLAKLIHPSFDWRDIVLPDDTKKQLEEIAISAVHQRQVYEKWGFVNKTSMGKGLSMVFAGDSGTGKTMAAEVIANELNTVIYKIDLASVVSKYIGETEKNLSKIFNAAEKGNCILLFDEADAIFGKRSAVKDARDRYANIETSYLLQRIEEYEGIVILTTNLLGNIDSAFMRRIKFVVNFRKPDREIRKKIWKKIWPKQIPLADDVDYDYIADTFEFSGGNIKNAALAAAFLAAEENKEVDASHIATAIRRESQKSDQIYSEQCFDIPVLRRESLNKKVTR